MTVLAANEIGELKDVVDEENKPRKVIVVHGSYVYRDSDGKPQTITYSADETGYKADGDSVPKLPSLQEINNNLH
ncbi:Cuticle protein 4 [Operophtera brumata]|uniref:Cuticle protein 4 n=1 Tax=Operophtera brumata TaxID=104452 RepID=A0A0L7LAX3_OPEBR|nr:Cuticle protein 4 [Operophtera brumata]